jgi:glutathione S-transferase
MYTLWIANKNYSSWSLRPWVLMKTLGIPFEEMLVPFADSAVQDDFKHFSPTAKVPCLGDGERRIWDSLSITEYLAERHDGIWPKDPDARAWARSVTAEMHSGFQALRSATPMNIAVRVDMNPPSESLKRDIARIDEIWTEGFKRFNGTYLCGDAFTAADAFFAPVCYRWQTYGFELSDNALGYAHLMLTEPAMLEWEREALMERWPDEAHEAETRAAGKVVKDLRNPGMAPSQ